MNEQEILEQRSRLNTQMQEILDTAAAEKRSLSAEETSKYDKMEADLDGLSATLERQRKQEQRNKELAKPNVTPDLLAAINGTEADKRSANLRGSAEYRNAFAAYLRDEVNAEQRSMLAKERRALAVGTNNLGGYTVPQMWEAALYKFMTVIDSVRSVATVVPTSNGEQINWPTADDTGNTAVILGENTTIGASVDPSFGTVPIKAYKYSSQPIMVPLELLQDSIVDIEAYIQGIAGERIGRLQNSHFTTGDGTGKPFGIVTGASAGKTGATGQTTSVTYDDLIDLVYSVSRVYRNQSKFMLADSSIKVVRKLKDSTGLPLWQPSTVAGQPDTLLGYPVVTNDNVAAMAANAKSIYFGDFSKYLIRDVSGWGMVRLNERYADLGQVAFIMFGRSDGRLLDTNAVKYYANSAT